VVNMGDYTKIAYIRCRHGRKITLLYVQTTIQKSSYFKTSFVV